MTDREALLFAICSNPADLQPRREYADLLMESENPAERERGEFIQVQIELESAKLEHPPPTGKQTRICQCRWCRLKCRSRELCQGGYPQRGWLWAGEPLNQIHYAEYDYHCGFVDTISCTMADWLKHGQAIARQTPVVEVRISDREPIHAEKVYAFYGLPDGAKNNYSDALSKEIFDLLQGGKIIKEWGRFPLMEFPSHKATLSALSQACIAWARRQAGLP